MYRDGRLHQPNEYTRRVIFTRTIQCREKNSSRILRKATISKDPRISKVDHHFEGRKMIIRSLHSCIRETIRFIIIRMYLHLVLHSRDFCRSMFSFSFCLILFWLIHCLSWTFIVQCKIIKCNFCRHYLYHFLLFCFAVVFFIYISSLLWCKIVFSRGILELLCVLRVPPI